MKDRSWKERYDELSHVYEFVLREYYKVLSALGYCAKMIDAGQLIPCRYAQDGMEVKNETKE